LNTNLAFKKSIAILDNILRCQRSPFVKTCIGYDNNQNTLEENHERYANFIKTSNHSENNNNEENYGKKKTTFSLNKDKNEFRRVSSSGRPFTTNYQNILLNYFFSCKYYGINDYMRNTSKISQEHYKDYPVNIKTTGFHGPIDRNYNPFNPLHYKVECYK
jgi:hypothetical protein